MTGRLGPVVELSITPRRASSVPADPSPAAAIGRDEWLAATTSDLGATASAWIPLDGRWRDPRAERQARALDWSITLRLERGACGRSDACEGSRSARARAQDAGWVWVRAGGGGRDETGGILALRMAEGRALGEPLARALGELCATRELLARERADLRRAANERAVGRRAAGLVHDLRNQLTLALCQLERVRAGPPADSLPELERALESAREMCAGSLAGSGARPARRLHLRPLLVGEARAAGTHVRRGRDIGVLVRCPPDLALLADAGTLSRLVRNLISNALEASFTGGEVRVEAHVVHGDTVVLSVGDRGRGIAAERALELFSAGVTGGGGSGWGTSAVQDALGELGGELELESEPGRGTIVRVRLPAEDPVEAADVLLVDPERERRERRRLSLLAGGARVIVQASAEDALARVEFEGVRLVLVARGLAGPAVLELRARTLRSSAAFEVWSALDPSVSRARRSSP